MIKNLIILLIKEEITLKKEELINKFMIGLKTKANNFEYKVLKLDFTKEDVYNKLNKCLRLFDKDYNIKYVISLLYNHQLEVNLTIYLLNTYVNRFFVSTTSDIQEENSLKYKNKVSTLKNIYSDSLYKSINCVIKSTDVNLTNDYNSYHGSFIKKGRENYILKRPIIENDKTYIWNGPMSSSDTHNLFINKNVNELYAGENFLQSLAVFDKKSQFSFFYDVNGKNLIITDSHTDKKTKLKTEIFPLLVGGAYPTNSLEMEGNLDFDLYISMGYRLYQHLISQN